jgi:hypothetical protein
LRWAGIGSGVILLLLLGFLFGWAWSKELAFKGIGFGLFVILVLYTFSTGLRAGGLSSNPETEIWRTTPFFQEADLLQKTVKDVSEWNKGDKDLLEVTLEGIDSPSLEWLFRDTQNLRKIEKISYDTTSAIIITPDKTDISLSNAYRGQDFIWHQTPNWSLLSFSEWATWLVFRKTPLENENIILWVRADLFPGNQSTVSGILK